MKNILQFWRDKAGATMTEYALLLVFIALIVVVGLIQLGETVNGVFTRCSGEIGG